MASRISKDRRHLLKRPSSARRKLIADAVRYGCRPIELLEDRLLLAGWSTVGSNGTPAVNSSAMMLLSDGTVMATGGAANSPTASWFKLTPNGNDYAGGNWTPLKGMSESRQFFGTTMLPDGRVFAIGGEYPIFSGTAEIYDPLTNLWNPAAQIPTPATNTKRSGAITGASNTTPIVITTSGTTAALTAGAQVTISGVTGNTAANGTWTISNVSGTGFTLNGTAGNGNYVLPPPPAGPPGQWTTNSVSQFGDDPLMLLSDGTILAGYYNGAATYRYTPGPISNPAALGSWAPTAGGKLHAVPGGGGNDQSDEESWVKLPDGSVLSYDVFASQGGTFQAQRYVPALDQWVDASNLDPTKKPGILSTGAQGSELGPGLLLPDGRVLYFGTNGNIAYYTPSTDLWSAGLQEPSQSLTVAPPSSANFATVTQGLPGNADTLTQLVATDNPGAVLPNGHVLVALSPVGALNTAGNYNFPQKTFIYDFNPLDTNPLTAWKDVTPGGLTTVNAFETNMLMLPTGQVLLNNQNGGFQIYTPDGQPDDAWRPVITGIGDNGDGTYTLTGTQLNGISEGATYGDDEMQSSNYPIIELQDSNDTVSYARTYNWSNKGGVASGQTPETVQFTLPPGKTLSDYTTYRVIANGLASAPAVNGLGPSIALPEFSNVNHAPAVAWVNGQAYIAWRGRDNHLLNIMRLNADGTPAAKYIAGATLDGSPALTTIGNQMYVAFTGEDEHLYISPVTINGNTILVPALTRLGATSDESPALASFNGKLYIAWQGQGDDLLNIAQLNLDLSVAGSYTAGVDLDGSPALAAAYGRLWVAFTGESESLYVSAVDINGNNLSVPPLNPLPETSNYGPALANINGVLNIAWTSQDSNSLNLMKLNADGSPVEPHIIDHGNSSDAAPALGSNNGGIALYGFTGTDGNGTLHVSFAGDLPPVLGASVQNGALVVNGGNVSDTITIGKNASGDFEVTLNGTTTSYSSSAISSVVVYTSPLTNTVNVQSTIFGLPVTINTGPGSNTINVASVGHKLSAILGQLTINGAIEGGTKVVFDDSADNSAQTYTLTGTSFKDNSGTITFANLGGIVIKGGGGANDYNVTAVGPTTSLTLNVGNGAATVNITSTGIARTSILGPIAITGANGSTKLNVDDQFDPAKGATVNISTQFTAGTIKGLVPATISYDAGAHVNAVNLWTNHGGGNSVNLLATGVPISINPTRVSAALKSNFVTVGSASSIQTIGAPVMLGDPGNADTIFIDAGNDLTIPFTLEQFTPAGDTPYGRLLLFSPAPISFRLADTGIMRVLTSIGIDAVVLADQGGPPGIKGLTIKSQPNVTVRNMTLPDGLSATGTTGLHLSGNTIGTTLLLDDVGSTLDGNTMGQVTLNHSANPSVTGNTMQSLTLTGATIAPVITNNSIIGALTINGASASNVTITGNRIGNMQLAAASDGVIENNDIGWTPPQPAPTPAGGPQAAPAPAVGLNLLAAFNGTIDHNDIHAANVGVNYAVPEQFISNRIFGNGTGIIMPINDTIGGLGYFAGSGANDIFNNSVGINDTGRMQKQHIYSNLTGVTGSGLLGTDSFDTANLIESNEVGADFNGTIQFTRFALNAVGIAAWDRQIIEHNLIYRGTLAGIRTRGADDVRITQNTFYNTAGSGVMVDGGSTRTELYNNAFRADGGYDLNIADDSRSGFFSDYNILYSTGAGHPARVGTHDLNDIVDVRDLNQFDLHSIGASAVGTWAAPQFANLAADDYRTMPLVSGLRASSPAVDAGATFLDVPAPPGARNLLANPTFESGTAGWLVNVGGGTQTSDPFVFSGTQYFAPGGVAAGSAEQTIDLIAAGFSAANLDGRGLAAVFGGRIRSAGETLRDEGRLVLTFLNGSGAAIGAPIILTAGNTADRWELVGGRELLPVGTRSIRYRFEATRRTGTTNDCYLDGAFLDVRSTTAAPDIGAYGATTFGDVEQGSAHIQLLSPMIYVDWTLSDPHLIQWQTLGNSAGSAVKVELYQDGPGGPQLIRTIAASTPDTGELSWIPENFGLTAGMSGLRIQVSLVAGASVADRSAEGFAIPSLGHAYYVNDSATSGDEYTTAPGSNRNTGRTSDSPKPSILSILHDYTLNAGDIIYVDTGAYEHSIYDSSVVLSGDPTIGSGQGLTITGPVGAGHEALIDAAADVAAFDLNAANLVTLKHLHIVGGTQGVLLHNASTLFTGSYLTVSESSAEGIRIESTSTGAALDHLDVSGSGRDGILVQGAITSLADSKSHGNTLAGISLADSGAAIIEANELYGNANGIIISNLGALATVGNLNLVLGRGNRVHDNSNTGISASGNVLIAGNAAYNNAVAGIVHMGTGSVVANVVFDNYDGIRGGTITNNRVYHNANAGVTTNNGSGPTTGNVIYSNGYGIAANLTPNAASLDGPFIVNNLIYANSIRGIQVTGGRNAHIYSNTIDQLQGDAIRVDPDPGGSGNGTIRIRDNILAVGRDYAINVNLASQTSVTSDYNDFVLSGTGQAGIWSGAGRGTLQLWRGASGQDINSLSIDPLFVDADGADNVLGYQNSTNDGRDDDFHLRSAAGSFHGGSLAPARDSVTGLPISLTGSYVSDANTSPAIDRGDPAFAFASEPSPNGAFVNLGAYGNTTQASKSVIPYVTVTLPGGGEIRPVGQALTIQWRSQDIAGTVDIQLWRVGGANPALTIATGTANDGDYSWAVPAGLTPASDYFIRVVRPGPVAGDSASFSIAPAAHFYYVNDDTVAAGDVATAPGSDINVNNTGLDAAHPKASIQAVLDQYDLGPDDVILVDYGVYVPTNNIVITNQDSGVTIKGPAAGGGSAIINRNNTAIGSYVFELQNADNVTISNLSLTGAERAIVAAVNSDSDNLTISNNDIYLNSAYGISIDPTNDNASIINNNIHNQLVPNFFSGTGVGINGDGGVVSGNSIHDNRRFGIEGGTTVGPFTSVAVTISGNDVYANQIGMFVSYGSQAGGNGGYTISGNQIHDNTDTDINLTSSFRNSVAVNNTVYGAPIGINLGSAAEAKDNVIYNHGSGIFTNSGYVTNNRVYNNTIRGIYGGFGATVTGNKVYSNLVGIEGDYVPNAAGSGPFYLNNLVYANTNFGIQLRGGRFAVVENNTIYQPTGDALRLQDVAAGTLGAFSDRVANNILVAGSGYAMRVDSATLTGLVWDYNDIFVNGAGKFARLDNRDFLTRAAWLAELGFDAHSLTTDPQFVDVDGADNILGYVGGVDSGADDDFHIKSTSPTIDAGDPNSSFLSEPLPNGARVNQGSYGNTQEAAASAPQFVQVLLPNGLERVDAGTQLAVKWRSSGLTQNTYIGLLNVGGADTGDWKAIPSAYAVSAPNTGSFGIPIDTSLVPNPAPQSVYTSYTYANNGPGSILAYSIPVADGNYNVRLHWMEPSSDPTVGARLFDIRINGTVVQSNVDVRTLAGASYKAIALSFPGVAIAGSGLLVELISKTVNPAFLCGLEITAANPAGIANPTANLDYSTDGGANWTNIATNQPMDLLGRGTFNWTVPNTPSTNVLIRVRANGGAQPSDVSDAAFTINSLTHDFYIDPAGDNANSGRSPDAPMASLAAILATYDFGPGDTIHAGGGTYSLINTIAIDLQDSGVVIQGPATGAPAIFNRGNASSPVFLFTGADDLTLDHIAITGGSYGIESDFNNSTSDRITVSNLDIYGNVEAIFNYSFGSTGWSITGNKIHDNDQGMEINYTSNLLISGNQIYGHRGRSITATSFSGTIAGNVVFNNGYGIEASSRDGQDPAATLMVTGNTSYNNGFGINITSNVIADSNTVYGNANGGFTLNGGVARNNLAYDNLYGIVGTGRIFNNRLFNNSVAGIYTVGDGAQVVGNTAFNNPIGIEVINGYGASTVRNNLVYNNSTAGIVVHNGTGSDVTSNTVFQPVGDGIRIDTLANQPQLYNASVQNNIVQVATGVALNVSANSGTGLISDYNDFYTTGSAKFARFGATDFATRAQWFLEFGYDPHSISADPLFVDPDGPDDKLAYNTFGLLASYYNNETFSGTPVLQRAESQINTVPAYNSPAPGVNLDHFSVRWTGYIYIATDGQWTFSGTADDGQRLYLDNSATALIDQLVYTGVEVNATTTLTAGWHAIQYDWVETLNYAQAILKFTGPGTPKQVIGGQYLSQVPAAPSAVTDDNFQLLPGSPSIDAGNPVSPFNFEPDFNGSRINQGHDGNTAAATTSAPQVAQIISPNGYEKLIAGKSYAINFHLAGIPSAAPTATLLVSLDNGLNWTTLASNIAVNASGIGVFNWTPATTTTGNSALIRVVAEQGTGVADTSDNTFLIANNGHDYYINDASTVGDSLTTAIGDNANSGKTPDKPMASLYALLQQYDLNTGDTIHIDNGTYLSLRDYVITPDDSGMRIQGPVTGAATLNRNSTADNIFLFDFAGADDVTLDRLKMVGGNITVRLYYGAESDRIAITNSEIVNSAYRGIFVGPSNDDPVISGNTIHDISLFAPGGIEVTGGPTATISGNTIFNIPGSGIIVTGASSPTAPSVISGNTVYGNTTGITTNIALVSNNIVRNNTTGINLDSGIATALHNQVFSNQTGIATGAFTGGAPIVDGNRVYNNSIAGVAARGGAIVRNNLVYSNAIGITGDGGFHGQILSNLIYSNANQGILFTAAAAPRILDNTIYQPVGDGIRIQASPNTIVRNNILYVQAGTDLFVAADSQTGFSSDYNILHLVAGFTGFWASANRSSLSDWQTASGQDLHSTAADALFIDVDGADNVLGYSTAGAGYDGGVDDNFYLQKTSIAIDSGDSWNGARYDNEGAPSPADDLTISNTGSPEYFPATTSSAFTATGAAQNFRTNASYFTLNLPFTFSFYGVDYTSLGIGNTGVIRPGGLDAILYDADNSVAKLTSSTQPLIAALWDHLGTTGTDNDVFVEFNTTDPVKWAKIRWSATNLDNNTPVNFAVVLFADGKIRFDYGSGNAGLSPTIGISSGNGFAWQILSGYDGAASLASAQSVLWSFAAGFRDIGAYEFRGQTSDTTPPAVTTLTLGASTPTVNQIGVTFSEALNAVDARSAANYQLRWAGPNSIFGDEDDVLIALSSAYSIDSTQVILSTPSYLKAGLYRLTVFGSGPSGQTIRDLSGNRVDGDSDGVEGGNFQTTFTVTSPTLVNPGNAFDYASFPQKLSLKFSADVGASLSVDDLSITGPSGLISSGALAFSYDPQTFTGTWSFASFPQGILPDGNYRATLLAADVTDAAGNAMAANFTQDFFALAGDANHDRTVGFADLVAVAQNYGKTGGAVWAMGDFNHDGNVGFADLVTVAQRYGTVLAPPASGAASVGADLAPKIGSMPAPAAPATPKARSKVSKSIFSTKSIAKSIPIKPPGRR